MDKDPSLQKLEDKMASYVDQLTGKSSGMVKTAHPNSSMTNNSYRKYRSSFLTLSDMEIPDDYRDIFRWCRYFFKFDPLIGAAVRSLATFPVTDWILNDTEESDQETSEEAREEDSEEPSETYVFYKNMLNDIDLYTHMIEIGYDYWLYANCIIFAEPGRKTVKRRDKETGQIYEVKEVVWKSVQRLDPVRLRIDRNPQTNEKEYYYKVPEEMQRVIKTKKPKEKFDKIPEVFKKAVANKGLVKLKSEFVHQLQMPSESGDNGLWATPPVTHAMKLILYSNILRQAQEAIAHEHIIPRRVYHFTETQEFSANMSFAQAAEDFSYELKKQLDDPNYQIISPIPISQIQHGGQGKALMLVPELEQLQETILAAMGVPREFVFGGLSYSGSTTSLRILENHFITYRTGLLNYINNFLIKRLAEIRGEWETIDDDDKLVKVSLSELKMQDDIQQKQLMINLNSQGKLPDEVMYEKVLGLDSTKVVKQLQSERLRKLQETVELQKREMALNNEVQQHAASLGQNVPQGANAPIVPEPAPGAFQSGEETPDVQGETSIQDAQQEDNQPGANPARKARDLEDAARQLLNMSESEQANFINKLPSKVAQQVLMYYQHLKANEEDAADMRPLPEQLPPRRQGGV